MSCWATCSTSRASTWRNEIGDAAIYVHLDVTDEANSRAALHETILRFGPPDILVNNVGILRTGPLVQFDRADLEQVLAINLIGPILGMKIVGATMMDAGRGPDRQRVVDWRHDRYVADRRLCGLEVGSAGRHEDRGD